MPFEGEKPWHSSRELQDALLAFHEKYASYPRQAIAEAKRHHEETMKTIRKDLQGDGVVLELQYTGSTYELIKVPSTEMEFDIMVVLAGGKDITAEETRPLYAELSTSSRTGPLAKIVDPQSNLLMPEKAANYFQGKLQQTITKHPEMGEIVLKRHGPAIQMDVFKKTAWGTRGEKFYAVDMVPSFYLPSRFSRGTYYVAKGFKEVDDGKDDNELALEALEAQEYVQTSWRKSFSLDEKDKIRNIDEGNKCRKQCMRMFKVLRDKEEGLKRINSYIIKTAALSLDRDYDLDWNQRCLGPRFINLLQYLAQALDENNLPHFYVPEFNLLADLSRINRENMRDRLKELIRSEQYFLTALKPRQFSSMYGRPEAYRQDFRYEAESDSDSEPEGAYAYSSRSQASMEEKEEGSVLPALVFGGAALAAALWVGASLFGGDKDKKDKDKK